MGPAASLLGRLLHVCVESPKSLKQGETHHQPERMWWKDGSWQAALKTSSSPVLYVLEGICAGQGMESQWCTVGLLPWATAQCGQPVRGISLWTFSSTVLAELGGRLLSFSNSPKTEKYPR